MFIGGLEKVAKGKGGILAGIGKALKGAKDVGVSAAKGTAEAAGTQTLSDVLKLKGLKHLGDLKGVTLKTQKGRQALGKALGKATPSLAAGGAYLYGGKKLYDAATTGGDSPQHQTYYY